MNGAVDVNRRRPELGSRRYTSEVPAMFGLHLLGTGPAPEARMAQDCPKVGGPLRVLVAHSVTLLGHAIGLILVDPQIDVIGAVATKDVPVGIDSSACPDVVLVECLCETTGCSDLLQRIRQVFPMAQALILCRGDLDADILADLVGVGASDFLKPDCSPGELISAIKHVGYSRLGHCPDPQQTGASTRSGASEPRIPTGAMDQRDVSTDPATDVPVSLAPREREVLEALAMGLSTGEVAVRLGITVHTVRTHLRNVLIKLDVHSKLQAVVKAMRMGLIDVHGADR
jgi:DNA-binding NarL/FixJ family response regulator